jgi:hypothetical protein
MALVSQEVQTGFLTVLGALTSKEQSVITRRIGYNCVPETLQAIGNDFDITRERVRQIEDVGIRKIGRIIKSSNLMEIQQAGETLLRMHGGLMTRDSLVAGVMAHLGLDSTVNGGILEVVLQSDFNIAKSKPQLGTRTYFTLPEVSKRLITDL